MGINKDTNLRVRGEPIMSVVDLTGGFSCSLVQPGETHLSVDPLGSFCGVLHVAKEMHREHVLRPGFLPGVAIAQPIISLLHLNNVT